VVRPDRKEKKGFDESVECSRGHRFQSFLSDLDCTSVVTVTAGEVGDDRTDEIHQYGISQ